MPIMLQKIICHECGFQQAGSRKTCILKHWGNLVTIILAKPQRRLFQYLEDNMGSGFNFQYAAGPKGLKSRVWVVCKSRTVQGPGGSHIIQEEAKLIRVSTSKGQCLLPRYNARGLAQHYGVI